MKLFCLNKVNFVKKVILASCAVIFSSGAFAQTITTASEFFKAVSDKYAGFKDYSANIDVMIDEKEMKANLLFMAPDKMRMDFSVPDSQTIVYDGQKLIVYLPESASVLTQNATGQSSQNASGLSLLRRYYSVSYEKGQDTVPLDEDSDEMVIKLILWRRSSSESFKNIKLSINPDTLLIRRAVAVTPSGVKYQFDFKNYEIDQGVTEKRFQYDIPSGANNYDDFLFSE